MKLQDFKFRIWNETNEQYELFPDIALRHAFRPEPKFSKDDELEIELCTGVKDSKGNEIYEGDILKVDVPWEDTELEVIGAVKYNDMGGYYYIDVDSDGEYPTCLAGFKICEIIGNIHENAELLKEKENERVK